MTNGNYAGQRAPSQEGISARDLIQKADEILAQARCQWDGRKNSDFLQSQFERRMQTGAYSANGESRRHRR